MKFRTSLSCILFVFAAFAWTVGQEKAGVEGQARPIQAEFSRVYGEWKGLLGELAKLKVEYRTANKQRQKEIDEKYKELIDQATRLLDELIAASKKAYSEAPNSDGKVTNMLLGVLGTATRATTMNKRFPCETPDGEQVR